MLSNVLPAALYRMQAAVGEALADAVVVLEGGWRNVPDPEPQG
jgi:hypothetical protein